MHTVQKMGAVDALWDMLDGIFACVLFDARTGEFCAARDPIGICPLYWGRSADGGTWFCSELKGLQAQCEHFDIFPPVRPGPLVFFGGEMGDRSYFVPFLGLRLQVLLQGSLTREIPVNSLKLSFSIKSIGG